MMTTNLVTHLKQHSDLNLADAAFTLQAGRRSFSNRRMLVCAGAEDAVSALETLDRKRVFSKKVRARKDHIVFMFPGQGSQYVNMGLGLYQAEPVYREQVDICSKLLEPHLSLDLREILYPVAEHNDRAAQQLEDTFITQPALFVTEYALARLWMAWGIRPQAMIGHSIGEYVAACLAGVFSLEDALTLVARRARMMKGLPGGTMLAIPLPERDVAALLSEKLSLAVVNGPSACVVSGPSEAVEELRNYLNGKGVDSNRLRTSHAFHSRMMDPMLAPFRQEMEKMALNRPQVPYLSNLTGTWITAEQATDPNYWSAHLRQTVRFADGMAELLRREDALLLEIGPGRSLSRLAKQQAANSSDEIAFASLRHPHDHHSDMQCVLTTLGKLWLNGVQIDWPGFYAYEQRRRIPLPTYPFERKPYLFKPARRKAEEKPFKIVVREEAGSQQSDAEPLSRVSTQSLAARPGISNIKRENKRLSASNGAFEQIMSRQLQTMSHLMTQQLRVLDKARIKHGPRPSEAKQHSSQIKKKAIS